MLAAEDGRYYHVPKDYEWKEEDKPEPGLTLVYWDYYNASGDVYRNMVQLHKSCPVRCILQAVDGRGTGLLPIMREL